MVKIDVLKAAQNERDFPLSNIVSDVEFVQLESTIESYFSLIKSYTVTDHYILITTQVEKKVLLFKRSGKFLRQIGQKGQGPGEYFNPCFATIDPSEENIIVKDEQGGNLFKYDMNGKIIKQANIKHEISTKPNCQPVFLDNKHFALSFKRPLAPTEGFYSVAVFDLDLNLVKKIIHKPNNDRLCLTNLSGQVLLNGSDGVHYWERFVDTIYSIDNRITEKPTYYLDMNETGYTLDFLTGRNMTKSGKDFNRVSLNADLPGFLIFTLQENGSSPIIYDKKSGEAFTPSDQKKQNLSYDKGRHNHIWDNDIFGFPKLYLRSYFPNQNLLTSIVYLARVSPADLEYTKSKNVISPIKRDQMSKIIQDYSGEELPLIVLLKVKK